MKNRLRAHVNRKHPIMGFLILALNCVFLCAAKRDKDKGPTPSDILEEAKQVMDLRAPGSPPFRLEENLRAMVAGGQSADGNYVLIWASPDRWKDELTLADFHETRYADQGKVWSLRTLRFRPSIAAEVQEFKDWYDPFKIEPDWEHFGKIKDRREGQGTVRCISLHGKWGFNGDLCFDAIHGYLLRKTTELNASDWVTTLENYIPLGHHFVPRDYHRKENGQTMLEVHITEAQILPTADPSAFAVPADLGLQPTCVSPTDPEPIEKPDPPYPRSALSRKIAGNIILAADINEIGKIEAVRIIKPLGPDFDKSAIETIKNKWRFKPAMCGETPVPIETTVEISFSTF